MFPEHSDKVQNKQTNKKQAEIPKQINTNSSLNPIMKTDTYILCTKQIQIQALHYTHINYNHKVMCVFCTLQLK